MSSDEDYINTQILDVDNTGMKLAQDILVTQAITSAVEDTSKGIVYNFGGKQALQAVGKRYNAYFTKEMMEKMAKTATQKVTGSFTKNMGKIMAKRGAKVALKTLGKAGAKSLAKAGTVTASGCTLGPAGCAAGAAISGALFLADLSFSIYAAVLDIQDKKGMLTLWHRDYVDTIAETYKQALADSFEKQGYPGLMDEEVFFYPEMFVFDYDENYNPYINTENKWGSKYIEYRNKYIKSLGIEDGWEERLESQQVPDKDLLNTEKADEIIKQNDEKPPETKKGASTGAIIAGVLVALFLIFFFRFYIV